MNVRTIAPWLVMAIIEYQMLDASMFGWGKKSKGASLAASGGSSMVDDSNYLEKLDEPDRDMWSTCIESKSEGMEAWPGAHWFLTTDERPESPKYFYPLEEIPYLKSLRLAYFLGEEISPQEKAKLSDALAKAFNKVGELKNNSLKENAVVATFLAVLGEITEAEARRIDIVNDWAKEIEDGSRERLVQLQESLSRQGRQSVADLCGTLLYLWSSRRK